MRKISLSIVALLLTLSPVVAMDHGFNPNSATTKWFESLKIPPKNEVSCCGKADAYPVERYERLSNGDYRVWIAPDNGITFPDGTVRPPWDSTIPIIVPKERVNEEKDDLDNPTDFSWLFFVPERVYPADGSEPKPATKVSVIYCFIRHPQGT